MAKCMWGPFEFQFPAWLVWPVFFLSLGRRGIKGLKDSRCRPAAQTARWKVLPGAITVRAHRLQQTGQPDGRMDDQAHGFHNTKPQRPKNEPLHRPEVEIRVLTLRSAAGALSGVCACEGAYFRCICTLELKLGPNLVRTRLTWTELELTHAVRP